MTDKPIVIKLVKLPGCCPSQWEAKTSNGKDIFIHYRCGHLTAVMGDEPRICGETLFDRNIGDDLDGLIFDKELMSYLSETISWNLQPIQEDKSQRIGFHNG